MKSYTDIEQSKKLAEIIPPESADMCWGVCDETLKWKTFPYLMPWCAYTAKEHYLPCWSLAALLDYLAKKDCFPEVTYTGTCYLMDVNFYDDEEGKLLHPIHFIRTEGKSLVDAGVEMILKLHEQKLI